ncbi:MAG TPA: CoA transferase [Dehalococcoidia bacterium]|nr:CoA transferase [Dehalococcoidia bacterium]
MVSPSSAAIESNARPGPLTGVRVLDLGDPLTIYAGKLLADLGADVILVEPPGGVPARNLPPFFHEQSGPATSLTFWFFNTSKRSVTCDLHTADGRALFARLVPTAQIVLEGGPPGGLDELGIGFQRFHAELPALIWAGISGFGSTGPRAGWLADDLVGIAMSGILTLSGYPDRPPVQLPGNQGWYAAGIQAAQGLLLALRVAEQHGAGQFVDVSMQEALSLAQETAMQTWDMRREVRKRQGEARLMPGVGTYECADGHLYSMVGIPGFGANWQVLAGWMAEQGMAEDLGNEHWQNILNSMNIRELTQLWSNPEKLADLQAQYAHVNDVLERFYKRFSKQYLYEEGQRRRLLIGPANTARDLLNDAQLAARGWFQQVEHPELQQTVTYPGPPYRLARSPWQIARRPPLPGEHNIEVFGTLGLSPADLATLTAAHAI